MEFDPPFMMKKRRIRIEKPAEEEGPSDDKWDKVQKYARQISQEPDPNLGRVKEIREEIKKGTYLSPEMIDEAAARLASRFLRKL